MLQSAWNKEWHANLFLLLMESGQLEIFNQEGLVQVIFALLAEVPNIELTPGRYQYLFQRVEGIFTATPDENNPSIAELKPEVVQLLGEFAYALLCLTD